MSCFFSIMLFSFDEEILYSNSELSFEISTRISFCTNERKRKYYFVLYVHTTFIGKYYSAYNITL